MKEVPHRDFYNVRKVRRLVFYLALDKCDVQYVNKVLVIDLVKVLTL